MATVLTGSEQISVLGQAASGGPASDSFTTTTQAIANLAGSPSGPFFVVGNQTPVARVAMKIDILAQTSTFPMAAEAGIWPTETYTYLGVCKEFDSNSLPGSGAGSPSTALFALAQNNGSNADVVAVIGDAVAYQNSSVVFGGNLIARSAGGGLTGVKLVGLEIDVEPASADTVGAGGGLFINAFNIAMPIPAIQVGGVGGGTFANGIILNSIAGAGLAPGSGATMATFINTNTGPTFSDDAIVLGNTHAIQWLGTSSNARARVDSSNNWVLTAPSDVFFEPVGNIGVRVTNPASAVNYLSLSGSATTTPVTIQAAGSDSNITVNIAGLGTGSISLISNGNPAMTAANASASAVNRVAISGSATTLPVTVQSAGSDTNIGLNLASAGTGSIQLIANGAPALLASNVSSAVNYVSVFGSATGSAVTLQATGSDTNLSINVVAKGTGLVQLYSNGNPAMTLTNVASPVNYLSVTGSATGNAPTLLATGSDTNVGFNYNTKGSGGFHDFFVGGTSIVNIAQTQISIGKNGTNTVVGTGSVGATTDTTNYILIPWCAGAPTGVPSAHASGIALRYDTTNHKLWAYDNGSSAWVGVVLS